MCMFVCVMLASRLCVFFGSVVVKASVCLFRADGGGGGGSAVSALVCMLFVLLCLEWSNDLFYVVVLFLFELALFLPFTFSWRVS